ncbi:hypothetical protein [Kitasatospora sp. NPDC058190]|uniref:hypothetical protein n=1 Tax=Kitasatospora sp. NPDC058190 TaxID=3346371 RepID=UPI0036DD49A3
MIAGVPDAVLAVADGDGDGDGLGILFQGAGVEVEAPAEVRPVRVAFDDDRVRTWRSGFVIWSTKPSF